MAVGDTDVYEEPIVYKYESGVVVRVRHPILTPEEREKRMKDLHDAAAHLLRNVAERNGGVIPKKKSKELKAEIVDEAV